MNLAAGIAQVDASGQVLNTWDVGKLNTTWPLEMTAAFGSSVPRDWNG